MGSISQSPPETSVPGNGVAGREDAPKGSKSALFTPLTLNNGSLKLSHRIILAPLTRNRGLPLDPNADPLTSPNRIWYPDDLLVEYYTQRTTPGGLLISEGIPPNLEGNGMPGVPGLFHPKQIEGWKKVVSAVHAKGGFIYAQLWNAGRASMPYHTGMPTISASSTPYEGDDIYNHPPPGSDTPQKYRDYPPTGLSIEGIKRQISDYCAAAKAAVFECGFDGVEIHGGNGYLPEQFLSSNINTRTDAYGGTPEKRCAFLIELMEALKETVGQEKLALRLTPFGLYNQARGTQRLETWGFLCKEIKKKMELSYVHFVEARYEQVHSVEEKNKFLSEWGLEDASLATFKSIFGNTPFVSAGGWSDKNAWGIIEEGKYDALAIGRLFLSTPDLVERFKNGQPLNAYDRSRFYGPFPEREIGYTDYPVFADVEKSGKALVK